MADHWNEFFDRREFRRLAAEGKVRINFDGAWHTCELADISGGGARFRAAVRPLAGTNVLLQMRGLGMIRATVVRRSEEDFSLKFNSADYDSGALVDNFSLPLNQDLFPEADWAEEEPEPAAPTAKDDKVKTPPRRENE